MNRRKLFTFLGSGGLGIFTPKLFAKPSSLTYVMFYEKVKDKVASVSGLTESQASLMRSSFCGAFFKYARISFDDSQRFLDSITLELALQKEKESHEFMTKVIEKHQKAMLDMLAEIRHRNSMEPKND